MTTKDEALSQACLIATAGSRAYGLNHADSDLDQMGIFIAPTIKVAGLDWNTHSESWTNTSPEGDDLTLHEVGKYLRLVLGGNPTLIELLFMDNYSVLTKWGSEIVYSRDNIISTRTVRSSYYGYAYSQLKRIIADGENYKKKMARHTLRIARQGKEILASGKCNVRVPFPEEYFELTNKPHSEVVQILEKEINSLREIESILNPEPDRGTIRDLLDQIRKDN